MNRYVSRGLMGVLFTGGLLALGAGVAHAAESTGGTDGSDSVLGGTQAVAPITLPVTASGNSVSIFGDATSSPASAPAPASDSGSAATSGSEGVASGTQAVAPIAVPITVGGNAVSVFGDAGGSGASGAPGETGSGSASGTTSGTDSALGGTQVVAPANAPVNASGNAVSVFGDASGSGSGTSSDGSGTASGGGTSGDDGIASGSQVVAPLFAPVNVGGNAISLFGDAAGSGASGGSGPSGAAGTSGTDSALGGTQVVTPVDAPVTVGGNAVAVAGDATSSDPSDPASSGEGEPGVEPGTGGDDSLAGGTQIAAPAFAPVRLVSNRIAVLGSTGSASSDPAASNGSGSGTATTSGSGSAVGGTQVVAPISVPVTVGGNTVGILGGTTTTGGGTGGGTTGGGTVSGTEVEADGSVALGVRPAALSLELLALTGTDASSVLFMALALLAAGAVILSFRVVFRKH